jgi:hypothetical protein
LLKNPQESTRANLRIVQEPLPPSTETAAVADVAPRRDPDRAPATASVPNNAGDFLEASVADDGGAAHMPVRRGSQHQYRAVLHEAIVRVADALDTHGVCDKQGRLRKSWISSIEGLIREARAIDDMLGLERDGPVRRPAPAVGTRSAAPADAARLPADIEDFINRMDNLPE